MFRILALLAAIIVQPASAAPSASPAAPDLVALNAIPREFSDAWARGDGQALGLLMGPDVDFITVGGSWLHGRADFSLYHQRLFDGRFHGSTITPLETDVRPVRVDLAFVRWTWRIVGDRNFDGSARAPRVGLMSMLVERRDDRWLVIASQNTNAGPGNAPENAGFTFPLRLPPGQPQ
ncbi:SgcJ/EcaC family oxidoreductase [Sphingopyxis sp.]|uniref:SgcJ/EcaC family oxidoreductase n=1 Tax=Sphingopyxis sp. TaxID=1908224 RepID=UPI002ED7945A